METSSIPGELIYGTHLTEAIFRCSSFFRLCDAAGETRFSVSDNRQKRMS